MRLAKRYAPKAAIFANGSLHNVEQAVAALDDGADIVTIGRGALANPDLPGVCPSEASSTTSTRRSLARSPTSRKPSWRCEMIWGGVLCRPIATIEGHSTSTLSESYRSPVDASWTDFRG